MKLRDYKKYLSYNEQQVLPMLKKAGLNKEYEKVSSCGEYFQVDVCTKCHAPHFHGFARCKSKYCALCNYSRYLVWFRRLYEFFEQWLNSGGYANLLTLTLKDGDDLQERLDVLSEAWRLLSVRGVFASRFRQRFQGGFKTLEVKLGANSGEWHTHIHLLVLKRSYSVDRPFLVNAWQQCLLQAGDTWYNPQVDIRSIKSYSSAASEQQDRSPLVGAVLEVLKYVVKISDFDSCEDRLAELVNGLKGKRQTECFGVLRNLKAEIDAEVDALSDSCIDEQEEKTCKICGCNRFQLDTYYKEILWNRLICESATHREKSDDAPDYAAESLRKIYNNRIEAQKKLYEVADYTFDDYLMGEGKE